MKELSGLFVQILLVARQVGIFKLGNVSLDGSKIKANVSKNKTLSYEHACKLEEQLKNEVAELLQKAEAADGADIRYGLNIPAGLERRDKRLAAIDSAKAEIEWRAAKRHAREHAAHRENMVEWARKEQETGKKPTGKQPKPPAPGPSGKDEVNLTDEDSRFMPTSGGFEQCPRNEKGKASFLA